MLKQVGSYIAMTKPRAMVVVLITAAAGYLLAVESEPDLRVLVNLLIGTALSGGGSIALNQWIERRHDALMDRTRHRPLPSGSVSVRSALVWGIALSIAGVAHLAVTVNGLTSLLAALCVASYVLLYTPLKRISSLNTAVGAVPGAIPPMMGWVAYTDHVSAAAWVLFLILFVWQFPHFLAIGWLYREDYKNGGYAMLSARDESGKMTARQMVLNAACLMVVSLLPFSFRLAGTSYAFGAVVLGGGLFLTTLAFALVRSDARAKWVLRGTIVHISALMALMVMDKV